MIDHVSVHVSDLFRSKEFYSKALAPLGYVVISEFPEWSIVGLGSGGKPDLWLSGDGAKQASHIAFAAPSQAAVDTFHVAGLEAGGKNNGSPRIRKEYSPGYYAAFLHDPDGHNIEVVFHDAV